MEANWYLANGFAMLALAENSKRPLVKDWLNVDGLSADKLKLMDRAGARIPENAVVIDVDCGPEHGGKDGLRYMEENHWLEHLDGFPTVITKSGGRHIFAKLPDGIVAFEHSKDMAANGVDLLLHGRQVVAAGTAGYRWLKAPPADLPELPFALNVQFGGRTEADLPPPERRIVTDLFETEELVICLENLNPDRVTPDGDNATWTAFFRAVFDAAKDPEGILHHLVYWAQSQEGYEDANQEYQFTRYIQEGRPANVKPLLGILHRFGKHHLIPPRISSAEDFAKEEHDPTADLPPGAIPIDNANSPPTGNPPANTGDGDGNDKPKPPERVLISTNFYGLAKLLKAMKCRLRWEETTQAVEVQCLDKDNPVYLDADWTPILIRNKMVSDALHAWAETRGSMMKVYQNEEKNKQIPLRISVQDWSKWSNAIANRNRVDKFKEFMDYLDKLPAAEDDDVEWVYRLPYRFFDFAEDEDEDALNAVVKWLATYPGLCAMSRAYYPGDETPPGSETVVPSHHAFPILIGPQGCGKSEFAAGFCPRPDWMLFNQRWTDNEKEMVEKTLGKMFVEVQEMAGLEKMSAAAMKSYISSGSETMRLAYGYRAENLKRRFAMIGTANESPSALPNDPTGMRRFVPIIIDGRSKADDATDCGPIEFMHRREDGQSNRMRYWRVIRRLYAEGVRGILGDEFVAWQERTAKKIKPEVSHPLDQAAGALAEAIDRDRVPDYWPIDAMYSRFCTPEGGDDHDLEWHIQYGRKPLRPTRIILKKLLQQKGFRETNKRIAGKNPRVWVRRTDIPRPAETPATRQFDEVDPDLEGMEY